MSDPWWITAAREPIGQTVQFRSERSAYVSRSEAHRQEQTVRAVLDLLAESDGVLIADDVGMGKTYEALGLACLALRHEARESDRRDPQEV